MTAVHEISAANGHARSRSTAAVQAQSKLARICQELAVEPIETIDETLRHCLPLVEEMLALGLVDRGDAADQLYDAFVANGLVQQRGPDAVQRIMADALSPKEPNDSGVREAAGRAWADTIKIERKPSWRDQTFTAAALQKQTFPPVRYVVPGLVPEGLTLFCGRPKIGKSWAGLDIAVAVASGGECFGQKTERGDVLYAALEDNNRRLQRRLDKLLSPIGADWPNRLTLTTSWRRLDKGGVLDIADWIKSTETPRLVILDTLAGVKPIKTNSGYAEDYESLTALHRLANDVGIAVLVLHHTRKLEAEDPLDTISGTLGLAGCADTALVFVGSSQGMSLYVRGRDIEEAEHAVAFNKQACRWTVLGSAAEVQMSETRQSILRVLNASKEPMGPSEIAGAAGLKDGVVRQRLLGMVEDQEVLKVGKGLYAANTP